MAFNTAAGATLSIGTTAAATDAASYALDTYTAVGEIEDLGEFGDAYNPVTFASIADARTKKRKGTADAGEINLVVAFDGADAGQQALKSALDDTGALDYNFKVQLNDAVSVGGDGTIFYFSGFVMSRRISAGGSDNVVRGNVTISLNTGIVEVAAT